MAVGRAQKSLEKLEMVFSHFDILQRIWQFDLLRDWDMSSVCMGLLNEMYIDNLPTFIRFEAFIKLICYLLTQAILSHAYMWTAQ